MVLETIRRAHRVRTICDLQIEYSLISRGPEAKIFPVLKRVFIAELAYSDKWEIQLQIVRANPLFKWTLVERRRAVKILTRDLEHPQKFVQGVGS